MKLKKYLRILIILLLSGVLVFSSFQLVSYYLEGLKQDQIQEEVVKHVPIQSLVEEINTPKEETTEKKETPQISWQEMKKINPDIKGFIYVPNTRIQYPVVHRYNDNDYYLRRTVLHQYNVGGSIFIDGLNPNGDLSDPFTTFYGHRMLNGSMFADIAKFSNSTFLKNNPYFYYFTEKGNYKIEIIRYDSVDVYNQIYNRNLTIHGKENANQYLKRLKDPITSSGITVNDSDKLVLLSTCRESSGDGRLTLLGRVVEVSGN